MPGGCLFQIKLDGFRGAAFVLPGGAVLQARSGSDLTARFPELHEALTALPKGLVMDGEVTAFRDGRFAFTELLRSPEARRADGAAVSYVAFDVLAIPDGHGGSRDMRARPLSERIDALAALLADVSPPVQLILSTRDRDQAMAWFEKLQTAGVEGLVVKPLAGGYTARQLKIRHSETVDGEVLRLIGPAERPDALRVRLPDGTEATTQPALDILQASEVATAAAALLAGAGPSRHGAHKLARPLAVEVRVSSGRHRIVRFVRVRGE